MSEDLIGRGKYGTIEDIAIKDEEYLYYHCVTPTRFLVFENEGGEDDKKYRIKGFGILEKSVEDGSDIWLVGHSSAYAKMRMEEIKSGYWVIIEAGE